MFSTGQDVQEKLHESGPTLKTENGHKNIQIRIKMQAKVTYNCIYRDSIESINLYE